MSAEATHRFILYVTGRTRRSERASSNLRELCAQRLASGSYEIEVVDVLDHPARAETDRVIATPTVIRTTPLPRRRVIGDLSIADQAAHALDLPGLLRSVADDQAEAPR